MKIAIALLALSLAGCAGLDTTKSAALTQGAAFEDRILHDAETVQCRVISVGAWVRRYGSNPALASAWRTLCGSQISELPK